MFNLLSHVLSHVLYTNYVIKCLTFYHTVVTCVIQIVIKCLTYYHTVVTRVIQIM